MNILPLGDRVIVAILAADTKSAGGLFIPETAQRKTQIGIIKEVGDDPDIKLRKNQKVIYDKYAGVAITEKGEEHLILREKDILGIFKV